MQLSHVKMNPQFWAGNSFHKKMNDGEERRGISSSKRSCVGEVKMGSGSEYLI